MVFSKLATGLVDRVQRFFTSPTTIKVVTQSLAQVMLDQTHINPLMAEGLSTLTPLSYLPTLCPVCFTQWLIVRRGGDGDGDKPCSNCGKILQYQRGDSRGFGDHRRMLCDGNCLSEFEVKRAAKAIGTTTKMPWYVNSPPSDSTDASPLTPGFRSWQPMGRSHVTQQVGVPFSMVNLFTSGLLLRTLPTPDFDTCPMMTEDSRVPQPKLRDFQWTWIHQLDIRRMRHVGEGSYGEVSLCVYKGERVVIKTFNDIRNDMSSVLYEADVGAMMSVLGVGPPIVGMLRPDHTSDMPGIMWKMLPKTQTMADVIKNINNFELSDLLNILSQIASLLRVMHSQNVLHNDIKANNIIVTANPLYTHDEPLGPQAPRGPLSGLNETHKYRVYMIDFGNATYNTGHQYFMSEEEQKKYREVQYLAPETWSGEPTTAKSDVFSFGHLLQMTGEYCFDPQLFYQVDMLARECQHPDPAKRPTMAEVERRLTISESKYL